MATGGMLTPGRGLHESQYNRAELRAATEAAHDAGLPVTAHAHGGAGIADALAAAVDGIEHATFVTEDAVGYDEGTVDRIAAAGVVVSATEAWLPSDVPFPPAAAHRLETVWQNFLRMHDAGVRLAVSSDAGVGPRKPHDVLPYGAVLFGDLGLSSHAVLTAVTATPAAACGVGDRKARLAAGYDADLLIGRSGPDQRSPSAAETAGRGPAPATSSRGRRRRPVVSRSSHGSRSRRARRNGRATVRPGHRRGAPTRVSVQPLWPVWAYPHHRSHEGAS